LIGIRGLSGLCYIETSMKNTSSIRAFALLLATPTRVR